MTQGRLRQSSAEVTRLELWETVASSVRTRRCLRIMSLVYVIEPRV